LEFELLEFAPRLLEFGILIIGICPQAFGIWNFNYWNLII
jgi:hypothetical protein